ncbi:chymotrypsinogen A-like [Anopheles nili]|uniref:chymotrypsinogen A-like n=1 Tax=Anopheles nili TaxID=185578 RepID=UPI00237A5B61|nr:chymotrypsinogen A-like [Anopheles nili]
MIEAVFWQVVIVAQIICLLSSLCPVEAKTVRVGNRCKSSIGLPGRCVLLDHCPKLKAMEEKTYLTRDEIHLLIGASGACPKESEQYCCVEEDIRSTTIKPTTDHPQSTERFMERDHVECLQDRLGISAESIARSSLDTSFGVFITYSSRGRFSRCVGSLITPEYVLTAAHCVRKSGDVVLYVNAHDVTQDDDGLKGDVDPINVLEVIVHEKYNTTNRQHDIALVRLNGSISQGNSISDPKSICIPMDLEHDETASVGHTLSCFGWGINANRTLSNRKQWMTLERISLGLCQARMDSLRLALTRRVKISERNICTITITGHDAFAGYSGGPLMYRKDGSWFLIGLISFGVGTTSTSFPVVSINVQQYTSWILENILRRNV